MLTRVLIFIVERRSVEQHVIGTLKRDNRFAELLIFAEVEKVRTSGKIYRGSETISLGSLEFQNLWLVSQRFCRVLLQNHFSLLR